MKNLRIKKNQHYVPQSYLKRFTIDGEKSLIWSFDKENFEFKNSTSSIHKICAEDYYYYQQDETNGFDHITLEDGLSAIEKVGNDILDKIENVSAMPFAYISEKERSELSFYISLMLTRGPAFRDCINELHGNIVSITFQHMLAAGNFPEMPEDLSKAIKKKGLENVIKPHVFSSVSLQAMIEAARQISISMLVKNWTLMVSPKNHKFVTSDTPVSFVSATGMVKELGPGHPDAKIVFPISKKITLVISGQRSKEDLNFVVCDKIQTTCINQIIANTANKYVFCSEKHEWIPETITDRVGQKLSLNSSGSNFEIIKNPYKRKSRANNIASSSDN
jgi:hypothetical protein